MKIGEIIKAIVREIRARIKGNQIEKLNKSIELMTLEEVGLELGTKLSKLKKLEEIDNRTEELIKYALKLNSTRSNINVGPLLNIIKTLNNEELRQDFFDKFSTEFDEKTLKEIIDDKYSLGEDIVAKVFAKNYERANINEFLKSSRYSLIEKVYNELPQEIKNDFILEYVRVNKRISFDETQLIQQVLIKTIPIEVLKNEIIYMSEKNNDFYTNLAENIPMDFSDVQNYYRKEGHFPVWFMIDYQIEKEIKTAEDVIRELKFFKEEERKNFINSIRIDLSNEELKKLVESDEIEEELKNYIKDDAYIRRMTIGKSNEEKLAIYEELISTSKDEKTKNNYKIAIAIIKGEYDEIIEIIKSGECDYEYLRNQGIWLNFTDEQLKQIYKIADDSRLRADLLTLTRRKFSFGWDADENEQDDKDIQPFILVNKSNYYELVKNAKSYKELSTLMRYGFSEYKKEISFDQILELYQDIKSKDFENKKAAIELISNQLERFEIGENLEIEDIKKYIQSLKKIDNIELKQKLFDKIRKTNLENVYDELLESEDIDISDKYIILSSYMKLSFVNDYSDNRNENFREKFASKFKKLNEENNNNEYTEIFDFAPQYIYSEAYGKDINIVNYYNIIDCIKYLGSETVKEKLVKLHSKNHNIKQYINPNMLSENVIQLLDEDIMEFVSRYNEDTSSFGKIFEDKEKTNIFMKTYKRLKNIKTYSEEDAVKIAKFIEKADSKDFEANENLDLIIAIALSEKSKEEFFETKTNNEENKFDKYVENLKEKAREEIHSPLLNRIQALDAIGKRFFGITYDEMQNFVSKYATDVENLLNKYNQKEQLTEEEQNELKTLKVLRNIKEILNINDKKALVETFEELDKLEEFEKIDFALVNVLDENIRRVYAKDYKEKLYELKEEDKSHQVDGIDVYSPNEFNMLVHVVAAYGDFKLIDKKHPEKSAKQSWNNVDNKQNHILCTSYIGNSNMCYAKPPKKEKRQEQAKVIFGFSNISKNAVLMAAPYDIGSDTTTMKSDSSYHLSSFRTAENMIRDTRWAHNEICVERRLENQKDTNIQPDYIVCFDEINEESKKVAKDFGVSIVLIDTKQVAMNESKKIDELFAKFYKTKNPSTIADIINLYQTNLNSFCLNNPKTIEKYFNPSKMNEQIEQMIRVIDKEYNLGNRDNAIACYQLFYEALQKEIKLNLDVGLEPGQGIKNPFRIRKFNYQAKQRYEKIMKSAIKQKETMPNDDKVYEIISAIKERNQDNGR